MQTEQSTKAKLLVIGNGMVGQRLLETLVTDAAGRYDIEVLCEEPRAAYDRVQLTSFFSGKSAADLALANAEFFARYDITLHLNDRAQSIDRVQRRVLSADGRELSYD